MTRSIDAVACRSVHRALREPFRTALREVRTLEAVEVIVGWSDGSTTVATVSPTPPITGETAGSIVAAVTGPLLAAVRGIPLDSYEDLFRRLHAAMAGNTTAKCALDLAVHAALAPVPGGLPAWLGAPARPVHTDVTVSLADPDAMAAEAVRRVAAGFDVLKLKVGQSASVDLTRIAAVRRAVGPDVTLRLDANQGWQPKTALTVLDGLERAGIRPELVEQPVPARDLAGMAAVTRHASVPVLADESVHGPADVIAVSEAGAADLINVKLAKCGGLWAARRVVATAEACGLEALAGCMLEPGSTVAAAAALALTLPTNRAHDLDAGWLVSDTDGLSCRPPEVVPGVASY